MEQIHKMSYIPFNLGSIDVVCNTIILLSQHGEFRGTVRNDH